MSPIPVALPTRASTVSREDTSTGRDAHLEPGVAHDLGRRVGVGFITVSKHDVLPDADTARDGHTDLTSSNDNDDVLHVPSSL
jgi:hypothetical protein